MRAAWPLALLLLLAGCGEPADPLSADVILKSFTEAKTRVANVSQEDHVFSKAVMVPESANVLTVKAAYRSFKDGSFVLKNPQGNGARFDTFPAAKDHPAGTWFEARDPVAGTWHLSGHLTGGGAYAFGVYLD